MFWLPRGSAVVVWWFLVFALASGLARSIAAVVGSTNVDHATHATEAEWADAFQSRNETAMLELLRASPEKAWVPSFQGASAFAWALREGFTNVVRFILDRHVDVNALVPDWNGARSAPLSVAAESCQPGCVLMLLQAGALAGAKDPFGYTPLQATLRVGPWRPMGGRNRSNEQFLSDQWQTVKILLDHKAPSLSSGLDWRNISAPQLLDLVLTNSMPRSSTRTTNGETLLHIAAARYRPEAATFLIQAGLSVNSTNRDGQTPLEFATQPGGGALQGLRADRMAALLVAAGAQHNIFTAAKCSETNAIAKLLAAHPASVNRRDAHGRTPLHWATDRWPNSAIGFLIAKGADVSIADSRGDTPLHLAAGSAPKELLRLLLAAHPPLEVTNLAGLTPLAAAVQNPAAVKLLIAAGAKVEPSAPGVVRPLAAAVSQANFWPGLRVRRPETLDLLLSHGARADLPDSNGRPLLHLLNPFVNFDLAKRLIEAGANINGRDRDGNTMLHIAMRDPAATITYLPDEGVLRRQLQSHQWTLPMLRWLEQNRFIARAPVPTNQLVIRLLLELGADVTSTNYLGHTPLHLYREDQPNPAQAQTVARLLIARGASLEARDRAGNTPFLLATREGRFSAAETLLAMGANPAAVDHQASTALHLIAASSDRYAQFLGRSEAAIRLLRTRGLSWTARNLLGDTPLHSGLRRRGPNWQPNLPLLSTMIDLGADPAATNRLGQTALHLLLACGPIPRPEVERWVRAAPAALQIRDRSGRTPLFLTLKEGFWSDQAQPLLDAGADLLAKDATGETFLHQLIRCCGVGWPAEEFMRRWLPDHADVNVTNRAGDTLLHVAVRARRHELIAPLLQRGANPALANLQHETPALMAWQMGERGLWPPGATQCYEDALMGGDHRTVAAFLETDQRFASTPDANGNLPIRYTVMTRQAPIARQLLAAGSPLTPEAAVMLGRVQDFPAVLGPLQSRAKDQLLFVAMNNWQRDALIWLLDHGANANAQDAAGRTSHSYLRADAPPELFQIFRDHGAKPSLFDAIDRHDDAAMESILIANGQLASRTNAAGQTPLLHAILSSNPPAFHRLLELRADARATTPRGFTLLHAAAAAGESQFADQLLGRGAYPNARDEFFDTPLHWAARSGATNVAALLLRAGADINAQDRADRRGSGNTPLHTAAENFRPGMVSWLLAHGANPKAVERQGRTALEHARLVQPGGWWARVVEPGFWKWPAVDSSLRSATIAVLKNASTSSFH